MPSRRAATTFAAGTPTRRRRLQRSREPRLVVAVRLLHGHERPTDSAHGDDGPSVLSVSERYSVERCMPSPAVGP